MRVLHLLNGEFFSGVEQVVLTLVRHHRRVEPRVACLFAGRMRQRLAGTLALETLPMRSRADLTVVRRLIAFVRHHEIQLLHAHTLRANLVAAMAATLTGIPLVVSIHSPARRETTKSLKNALNTGLERALVPMATAYITVSKKLREEMIGAGAVPHRVFVVENGIEVQKYRLGCGGEFRASLGWADHLLVGTVALLRPRKGVEFLLRSFPLVIRDIPGCRLVVVGDPEHPAYLDELHGLCRRLGIEDQVRFVPFREDIPNILAALDIFVLPSLFGEGLPLVLLEAMAAARSVVATAVEGNEAAVVDGVTGLLVPPGDPAALARAIIELLRDPGRRARLGGEGLQRVSVHFSAERMTEAIETLYFRILQGYLHAPVSCDPLAGP
jgi:glycosyltransferase involved in cell wall biosynthesis